MLSKFIALTMTGRDSACPIPGHRPGNGPHRDVQHGCRWEKGQIQLLKAFTRGKPAGASIVGGKVARWMSNMTLGIFFHRGGGKVRGQNGSSMRPNRRSRPISESGFHLDCVW